MSSLNTVCSICTNEFNDANDVHSTICGHLFHNNCIRQWLPRNNKCPQCFRENPELYKLQICFYETEENYENEEEMLERIELNNKLRTSDAKLSQLVADLREREANFMQLQAQFTESSEYIKKLEDRINQLVIENHCKSREFELKKLEIDFLKANDNDKEVFKQKFEEASKGCGRATNRNISFPIPNSKMQGEFSSLSSLASVSKMAGERNAADTECQQYCVNQKNQNVTMKAFEDLVHKVGNLKLKMDSCSTSSVTSNENTSEENVKYRKLENQIDNDTRVSVFIKNIPVDQIIQPLENVVVNLALKMKLSISTDDLAKTMLVENNDQGTSKRILFAVFKSKNIKDEFFSKKFMLKNNPKTKFIFISEFLNEELHSVFKYAEMKLRERGFEIIYCKENKIFAKKTNRNRPIYIGIRKQDVDNFLKPKSSDNE